MFRVAVKVRIPRPCAEAWEAMTPVAQGRYCAACQQTVTDFRQLSDAEVLAVLRQAGSGRLCGQFRATQLERALGQAPGPTVRRWQTWLLTLAAVWSLRNAMPYHGRAQTHQIQQPGLPMLSDSLDVPTPASPMTLPASRVLRGIILDSSSQEQIPCATVSVVDSLTSTSTSLEGAFELEVPDGGWLLQISAVGYETRQVLLPPSGELLRLELKPDEKGGFDVAP